MEQDMPAEGTRRPGKNRSQQHPEAGWSLSRSCSLFWHQQQSVSAMPATQHSMLAYVLLSVSLRACDTS